MKYGCLVRFTSGVSSDDGLPYNSLAGLSGTQQTGVYPSNATSTGLVISLSHWINTIEKVTIATRMNNFPPPYVQYHIRSGYLRIVSDSGQDFGVFSAQPLLGKRFPSLILMHDWMGLTPQIRLLTDQLAQAGFVVITPDLFDGQTATTPQEAQALLKSFSERRADQRLQDALEVLKKNHATSQRVGVIGVGLGGGFALKAAVTGVPVQAVVMCSGFPQRWLGQLKGNRPPILALYGANDPLIPADAIEALRVELGDEHAVIRLPWLGHELWPENPTPAQSESAHIALRHIVHFFHTTLG